MVLSLPKARNPRVLGALALFSLLVLPTGCQTRRATSSTRKITSAAVDEARQRLQADDYPGAVAAYDRALEENPLDPQALLGVVSLLLDQGHVEAAEARISRLKSLTPDSPMVKLALGMVALRKGDPKLAGDLVDVASSGRPQEPAFYLAAAGLYGAVGRACSGVKILEKARDRGLANDEAMAMMGNLNLPIMRREEGDTSDNYAWEAGFAVWARAPAPACGRALPATPRSDPD